MMCLCRRCRPASRWVTHIEEAVAMAQEAITGLVEALTLARGSSKCKLE